MPPFFVIRQINKKVISNREKGISVEDFRLLRKSTITILEVLIMSILKPDLHFKNVTEIDPQLFVEKNINFIIFDIDNTLAEFDNPVLFDGVREWLDRVQAAGINCCLASNNRRERVEKFNEQLGFYAIWRSAKPFSIMLRRALKKHGFKPSETCVIGDQIFADIMAANLGGMTSILVDPLTDAYEGWFVAFKRWLEKFVIDR